MPVVTACPSYAGRRRLRHAIHAALLTLPLAAALPAPAWAAGPTEVEQGSRPVDIPAGPLSSSLSRFAAEAGIVLSVDGSLVAGRQAPALSGRYTPEQGLARLLEGSGLQATQDAQGTWSLRPVPGEGAATELAPMVIEGFALGNALGDTEGYNATHSMVATKTSMPLLETPQTVSVVTRQQIEDQGARNVSQALRYTPGVMSSPYGATTRYDYVAMRGINDGSVDNLFLDGLKLMGDSGTYSSLQVDPYFIERIDVLKGPSSVLYGRSLPGGLVAMTTKKPQYESRRQLQLSYGSHDYKQAAFDFTGPLDDQQRIAYRLTGVAKDADTQVDGVEEQRYAVMPSLSINFSDDTRLTLLAMLQHDPESGYHGGLPADGTVTSHNGRRISRSFFEGDEDYEKFERDQQMVGYQLEHRFNDRVSARQNFQYLDSTVESGQVYQYGYATQDQLVRYYTGADEALHAWTLDNQVQFLFDTGALSHTLVTGLDYQRRKAKVSYDGANGIAGIDPFTGAVGPATRSSITSTTKAGSSSRPASTFRTWSTWATGASRWARGRTGSTCPSGRPSRCTATRPIAPSSNGSPGGSACSTPSTTACRPTPATRNPSTPTRRGPTTSTAAPTTSLCSIPPRASRWKWA